MGKINIVILSTFIGAITNVLLNILLVPRYGHNGTAIAYMLAEAAVTISMFFIGHKYIPVQFLKKQHLHYIGGCIVMGGCLHFISLFDLSYINTLIAMISVGGMVYVIVLLLLKDSIGKTIWETMRTVLIKK